MMPRAFVRNQMFKPALAAAACAAVLTGIAPAPLAAQETNSEARLRKIEAEIRALQRNVFPGGDGRYFEPQINAATPATGAARPSAPSTTVVTDILARLDALEIQIQRLTALNEVNSNAIAQLTTRITALEGGQGAAAAPDTNAGTETGTGTGETGETDRADKAEDDTATLSNLAAMGAATAQKAATGTTSGTTSGATSGPSAQRIAAVQAITKPQTEDPADDEYSYGFRLWNAGFYPEARQQLSRFLDSYPDHWRVTYARNLLGRAYLDEGNAEEAARWFFKNYKADLNAARAPDSLLFLAESMIAMGDTRRACIALAEFGETYPAVATGRLMDSYQRNRGKVTCEG